MPTLTPINKFEAKDSSNKKYCFENEKIPWGERLTSLQANGSSETKLSEAKGSPNM